MRAEPGYTAGQPIRLLTCHAGYGNNSFAQQLSSLMNIKVKAAPGWLEASDDGFHRILGVVFNHDGTLAPQPNTNEILKWKIFKPRRWYDLIMNGRLVSDWKHSWFGLWNRDDYSKLCPNVSQFIDTELCYPDEDRIIAYLKNAPVASVFATTIQCMLCNKEITQGVKSDGVFAWSIDTPHYIAEHSVKLPLRFLEHIRKSGHIPPTAINKQAANALWPYLGKNAAGELAMVYPPDVL